MCSIQQRKHTYLEETLRSGRDFSSAELKNCNRRIDWDDKRFGKLWFDRLFLVTDLTILFSK